ncbi:metal tolerance protein 4-like isoform X2 [Euphorbia lathyris]|uniref:metal tolerance protein 4-like isoform X2 n=1 Tax=Euphorbia lathyris TaxID=212925 RepID=UPI0033143679
MMFLGFQRKRRIPKRQRAIKKQAEMAMKISNYANVLLLAFKIYATVKSGSIAIAASTLDSLLDLMAGGILWFTHVSMKNINIYKYPIGKLRVQPVGIIVFPAIMATLGGTIVATIELIKKRGVENRQIKFAFCHFTLLERWSLLLLLEEPTLNMVESYS